MTKQLKAASWMLFGAVLAACWSGPTATQGAWKPLPRNEVMANGQHGAAWTGHELVVWGGSDCEQPCGEGQGGVLEPGGDGWRQISPTGEPSTRDSFSTAWTGAELFVWGGFAYD